MSLKQTIDNEIKEAMKAKDKDALQALRGIKSLILLAETSEGSAGELSQDAEIKLLTKAAKQRKESAEIYLSQGRLDLAEIEQKELAIIEKFLPKQMSEAEIEYELRTIMTQLNLKAAQDMGKLMGAATKAMAGKADGKIISALAKKLLG